MKVNAPSRVYWLDYARVIGIYLVVLGHSDAATPVKNVIYTFHMPLFFFLSGYLFSFEKYVTLKALVTRRAKQLLIPYFFFNVITYLFWVFVGRKFGVDAFSPVKPYEPLIGMFYGNGNFLPHDEVLWFLPCLFMVEVFFYVCFKKATTVMAVAATMLFALAGFACARFCAVYLPWGIDTAFTAIVFYSAAFMLRSRINALFRGKPFFLIVLFLACLVIFWILAPLNNGVDMVRVLYGNYAIFILTAFPGIFTSILLSRLLYMLFARVAIIEYLSMNTIVIFILHIFAFTFIKAIVVFVLKLPLTTFNANVAFNLSISLIAIIILVPAMYLFNKYLPVLIGKQPKTNSRPTA